MKDRYKNILGVILFLLVIILGASIINDLVNLVIRDKLNKTLIFIINWILTFMLLLILLKTKTLKNLEKSILGKNKK